MRVNLEQGQIVKVRNKVWSVLQVSKAKNGSGEAVHKTTLECLEDNGLGRTIDVIWEREISPHIIEATALPLINDFDPIDTFNSFITAIKWSCSSIVEGSTLQAPFRGGVQIEEYQLVPVIRAAQMPRVTLLIADDVGLGKTIEAGLVAQELIHTHRASKILVLCPAHLQTKWVDEMAEKFGLEFRIIDRDAVEQMKKEFGPTINPWGSFPRIVTSIDYLKREHPKRLFDELVDRGKQNKAIKPWDLLILDEAHNVAPSGRKNYVRDSDRTVLLRSIARHFEHRIFLTATPHNGYRESFTGLLELLDNLRFSRGISLSHEHLNTVTIRRLKDEITNPDGTRRFPPRIVMPRNESSDPDLYVDLTKAETEMFDLLKLYTGSLLSSTEKKNERALQFVLTLLKKRALSCPLAFRESLITHSETVGEKDNLDIGESLFRSFEAKEQDDWNDDEEKDNVQAATLEQASRLCHKLSLQEKQWLQQMFNITDGLYNRADSKAKALIQWINKNLKDGNQWNNEKVIIFTEYLHTLHYLQDILNQEGMEGRIMTIYGGMTQSERSAVNDTFQSHPDEHPMRILIATDAASEGADFQKHCRNLIHYEIPWNPVRLEQRNGRIDRHGQMADEVRIHHFVYRNQEDSEFLKRIIEKVETIRADLGSVGSVIAENVKKHALGNKVDLTFLDNHARTVLAKQDFKIDKDIAENTEMVTKKLNEDRKRMGIDINTQLTVLTHALAIEGYSAAIEVDQANNAFYLLNVPRAWGECRKYVTTEGVTIHLTFDRETARNNENYKVIHLDHPIMRRAISTLRSQMWKSASVGSKSLNRLTCIPVTGLSEPVAIAWGRILLLGPENNLLHEGLITTGLSFGLKCVTPLADKDIEVILNNRHVGTLEEVNLEQIKNTINPHVHTLEEMLKQQSENKTKELIARLKARGENDEKHARSLATERIQEIRKTIREMAKQEQVMFEQLTLFDAEEKEQRNIDLHFLKIRLDELEAERENEPKRIRKLYQVSDKRVYPLALEICLPPEVY